MKQKLRSPPGTGKKPEAVPGTEGRNSETQNAADALNSSELPNSPLPGCLRSRARRDASRFVGSPGLMVMEGPVDQSAQLTALRIGFDLAIPNFGVIALKPRPERLKF